MHTPPQAVEAVTKDGNVLPTRQLLRWLTAYALALAVASVLTLTLSLLHIHIQATVATAILCVALSSGVLWARWQRPPDDAIKISPFLAARGSLVILAVTAGVYSWLWFAAIYTPDLTSDGNAYHIPPMGFWARQGYIYWIDTSWSGLFNGYPKGLELFGYLLGVATGSARAVNTINLVILPMGWLAVVVLARRLGATAVWALAVGALLLAVPVHMRQATTTYVDSGLASAVMAFFAAVVFAGDGLRAKVPSPTLRQSTLLLGLAAGLALAIKPSAVVIIAVGGFALVVEALFASRTQGKPPIFKVVWIGAIAAVITFSISGYWYVRNYFHGGSPLFPVGVHLGNYELFPGATASQVMNEANTTPPALRDLSPPARVAFTWAQGLSTWPDSINHYQSPLGGLGFLWLLGGLPAAAWMLSRPGPHRPAVALLTFVVSVSFLGVPMNWWARYTVWLHALGLPCLAACATRLWSSGPTWSAEKKPAAFSAVPGKIGCCWVALISLLAVTEGVFSAKGMYRDLQFGERRNYLFKATRGTLMDQVLAGDAPVAVGPMPTKCPVNRRWKHNLFGALCLPLGHREVFIPASPGEILTSALAGRHFRYVIWDDNVALPDDLRNHAAKVDAVPGFLILSMPE